MASACARLPEIASGECGNGVIEELEDCDKFDADGGGANCRPKGAVGECHLDCTPSSEGDRPLCPVGWGCDPPGLCRRPTGEFAPLREYEIGSAASLLAGDFDGDGNEDVASLETPEGLGFTRARFHYFDDRAELRESREFSRPLLAPAVSDIDGDGKQDVAFADIRVGLLLGRSDRSWVPETFSSYRVADTIIRTLGVSDAPVVFAPGFLVFATFSVGPGVYAPDATNQGIPRLLGEFAPPEMLVGNPVSGHLYEDTDTSPCAQAVVAEREASIFWVFDACTRDPSTGEIRWQDLRKTSVALDPPAVIDAAPLIADVNSDGHLDVLVGADGRLFAALGDGITLATATPHLIPAPTPIEVEMPLAVGDVTGDGVVDYMFDDHGLFSLPATGGAPLQYLRSFNAEPGHWTVAVVADLNRDGNLDLIAASPTRSWIDFYNADGKGSVTPFRITTARPVRHLNVGDFDGDFINDLAFSQIDAQSEQADSVLIAFGAPAGPPLAPTQVARVPGIEQVSIYREGNLDHMLLTSTETTPERRGVLTLLLSGGDRVPVALYELTSFAEDGSTNGSGALRALGGHFIRPDAGDVLALGSPANPSSNVPLEFWLLPALTESAGSPVRLEGTLPPNFQPVAGDGVTSTVHVSWLPADLDNDTHDEVALVMPADDDGHCGLSVLDVEPDRVVERSSFVIEEPCAATELRAFDADADGFRDLVLLAGRSEWIDGSLSVFWNDGTGGFDAQSRSLIVGPNDPAIAFASFGPTPARNTSFMYATSTEIHLSVRADGGRDFAESRAPAPLLGCTGMTALDLDGDGARDLALATSGNISVLKALLENL